MKAATCCSSSTTSTATRSPAPRCPRCWGRMPSAVGYQPTLAEEMGPPAGAHHVDEDRLDHVDPGRVRAGRRPDRPVAGDDVRPPRLDRCAVARHRCARHLSGGRPARLDVAPARPERGRRGALHDRACRPGHVAAIQGAARHHRDSRHGRARSRGQADRRPGPGRSSVSCRSRSTSPRRSPARRASTCRSPKPSVASR